MSRYGNLSYGGVDSVDYGVYVIDVNDADMPRRDYTSYSIPGRSRDLHFDNGRYENIDRVYQCILHSHAGVDADDIINEYLASIIRLKGYQRIEDTLHPDYYKIGEYRGETSPVFSEAKHGIRFDLAFDCDSRKYLLSGETETTLASGTRTVINPGTESAAPLLKVTGSGTIRFGGVTMTIASHSGTMIIDCELGDAYGSTGHENLNQYLTLTGSGDFPLLSPGSNNIVISGVSSCKITPRWCKL